MHIVQELFKKDLPADCIKACSSPGNVTGAVNYWVEKLEFTVDRTNALKCLGGYGSWETLETDSDEALAQRILWLACCNFSEDTDAGEDTSFYLE